MRKSLITVLAILTVGLPGRLHAADAEAGGKLARRLCAICHAVSGGASPLAEAPPFRAIARSAKFRARGAALIMDEKAHPRMPNFAFAGEQAEDLAAYIRTLARRPL